MHDIAFPFRKTDDARRADQELVAVLAQMISADEPITVRAMVRRMTTLSQASSITRDGWRMGRITAAEHERIRNAEHMRAMESETEQPKSRKVREQRNLEEAGQRALSASPQLMLNEFDVSLRTGLAVATLRRWRWQHKGPAWKKLGTAVRYDPRAVEAWLVSRDVEQDHADDR